MTTTAQDIELYAGDTKQIACTVTDPNGVAKSLVGASIRWALYDECAGAALVSKTTASGITITSAAGGIFTVTISPSDTASLTPAIYWHEAEVTDGSGNIGTVFTGHVTLRPSRV